MKTLLCIFIIIGAMNFSLFAQNTTYRAYLNGNNVSAYFQSTGIFNQNTTSGNAAGYEWPKYSGRFAIFSTGLCIAAKVNNQYAQSMASYNGEFTTGYTQNGTAFTNPNFKVYKISIGDNEYTNPDYANWYLMIPYGAPYIDVNNNNQYDAGIDSIGIRNAAQVIFMCMTDGFTVKHTPGEGFGGGITSPLLYSQVAMTAWCYERNDLKDMQFMKWEIINKGLSQWNSTYFSLVADPDLGDPMDDYVGCDTSRKLGYCYNADNNDGTGTPPSYGAAPPAVGITFLKSPKGLTSFVYFTDVSSSPPPCESDPNNQPVSAYLMMKGFKKDSSNFLNPTVVPAVPTKFVYTGDPFTNTGWTEFKGSIQNCGGNTGNTLTVNPPGDRRFVMSSGAEDFTVNPNDTIRFYTSQMISRGTSNLNSVSLLKNSANTALAIYNSNFAVGIKSISSEVPSAYSLGQNYPNPFNNTSNLKFEIANLGNVKIIVYDVMGREVETLVNERLQAGTYETQWDGAKYSSGVYFYRIVAGEFSETKRMLLIK